MSDRDCQGGPISGQMVTPVNCCAFATTYYPPTNSRKERIRDRLDATGTDPVDSRALDSLDPLILTLSGF